MKRSVVKLALSAATVATLVACSGPTADEQVAKAREHIAAGKWNDASIELRNALQQHGDHVEGRRLLGRVFLQQGDAGAAITEFEKAMELVEAGPAQDEITLQTAQALLAAGQWRKLITRFSTTELKKPEQQGELKTMLAAAYGLVDERDRATESLDLALKSAPDHAPAHLLRARSLAALGQLKGAFAEVQGVLDKDARNADAWVLKGELHSLQGDVTAADQAWKQALGLDPRHLGALVAQVRLAMDSGKPEPTAAALAALAKVYPRHPQTLDLRARMLMGQQQWAAAREDTALLLRMAPEDPRALTLAADVEWRAGSTTTAQTHLQKALSLAPDDGPARRLYALTQVRSGEPELALQTLDRLLKGSSPSADALGLAGEAHLMRGAPAAAEAAFARAAAVSPRDARWPAAQAMAALARGDSSSAMSKLQTLAKADATGLGSMALIKAHMLRREPAAALKALDALEAGRSNTNPMLALVRGQLHQQLGDPSKARAAFEQALKLSPGYLAATDALAQLDMHEGHADIATQRMRALAKQRPNDAAVQLTLAQFLGRVAAPGAEVQAALEAAVRAAPQDPQPALSLTAYLLQRGRPEEALAVARSATSAFPNDDLVLEALAQAQVESGELQQAIASYRKLAVARQQSPQMLTALARAQMAAGENTQAALQLREALAKSPGFVPARAAEFDMALAAKEIPQAVALARAQQQRAPGSAEGWSWEARAYMAQGRWSEAADAWQRSLAKSPSTATAIQWQRSLRRALRTVEADKAAAQWLAQRPGDADMRVALGGMALAAGDPAGAESHYRAALAAVPHHVSALNNLASALASQGKPGAVEIAERANRLDPNRPALLDTWALAMASEGQLGKAVDLQKQTVDRHPRLGYLRLTLARLALKQGDKSLAREQLGLAQKARLSESEAVDAATLAKLAE